MGYEINMTNNWDCSIHLGKRTKVRNSTAVVVEGSWGKCPVLREIN